MNLKSLFCVFLLVISFSFVSAVEISMKDSVMQGENVVAHISGNFIEPITTEDIRFYRRHMPTSIEPFDLTEIDGDYYVSFYVPLDKEGDSYSLNISNVKYMVGPQRFTEDISKKFTIKSKKVPFMILPPLVITDSEFTIELQNLRTSLLEVDTEIEEKTYDYMNETGEPVQAEGFFDVLLGIFSQDNESISDGEVVGDSYKIYLESGEIKELTYPKPEDKGFQLLEFFYDGKAYSTLVYTTESTKMTSSNETTQENETVQINESESNKTTQENDTFWDSIKDVFDEDENDSEVSNDSGVVNESVEMTNETTQENESTESEENESAQDVKTCEAIGGSVCVVDEEKCEGDIKYSKSTVCCVGECVPIKKGSTGKTVGWVLIIAIALFVTWFLKKKYMKAGPKKPSLEKIGSK